MKFDVNEALTRDEALASLLGRWAMPHGEEPVAVRRACGRTLARDCCARYSLPRHRVSAFDGIAVRAVDFADGVPDTSEWKRGVQFAQADTGDDFPDEYDSIVAAEDVSYDAEGRLVLNPDLKFKPYGGIKPAGATMREGELLYPAGTLLDPSALAILAAGGWAEVPVLRKLRIAYIPTGTELVPVGSEPQRGENVQTNSVMLGALFDQWGVQMVEYAIVEDDRAKLGLAIDDALAQADIVLVNGGSSRGSEDYNSELLKERASWFVHGVKAVPGRPIGMAIIDGKPAINVPGPMIAASLAADWLIQGLVCAYQQRIVPPRVKVEAVLDETLTCPKPGFERLARLAAYRADDGELHCSSIRSGASLAENIRSVNAFLAVPSGVAFEQGTKVRIEIMGTVEAAL